MTDVEVLSGCLRCVVSSYGPHALADPVALRSALRTCGTELAPPDIEVVVAVAGSGAVEELRAARQRASSAAAALEVAAETALDVAGVPVEQARWALGGLGAALGLLDPPPGSPREPDHPTVDGLPSARAAGQHQISWDGEVGATAIGPAAPLRPLIIGRHRARTRTLVAVALVVGVAVLTAALLVAGPTEHAAPDRHAVEQVAGRYRALGAGLLAGAVRCAPLRPEPGELERIDCSFGSYSMVLVGYDTPSRLSEVRGRSRMADPTSVRWAATAGPGAAVAIDETRSGTSTIYWDADAPRPMSATVSTSELSLPDLVAFWDTRGFALVQRPELPGPAFRSGVLWASLGFLFGDDPGVECAASATLKDVAEEVICTFPNGVGAKLVLAGDEERFVRYRTPLASDANAVPGTHQLGTWSLDGRTKGQFAEGVLLGPSPTSYLYIDDPEARTFALFTHAEFSVRELDDFFDAVVAP